MKKILLLAAFVSIVFLSLGQGLQKGNLLGLHTITVTLQPNATMEQFTTFYTAQVIPAYEQQFAGVKGYLLSGLRGEEANRVGVLWIFSSAADRNKYFNEDGSPNEAGKAAMEKLAPIDQQLHKIGTATDKYTDWIVQ